MQTTTRWTESMRFLYILVGRRCTGVNLSLGPFPVHWHLAMSSSPKCTLAARPSGHMLSMVFRRCANAWVYMYMRVCCVCIVSVDVIVMRPFPIHIWDAPRTAIIFFTCRICVSDCMHRWPRCAVPCIALNLNRESEDQAASRTQEPNNNFGQSQRRQINKSATFRAMRTSVKRAHSAHHSIRTHRTDTKR